MKSPIVTQHLGMLAGGPPADLSRHPGTDYGSRQRLKENCGIPSWGNGGIQLQMGSRRRYWIKIDRHYPD